MIPSEIIAIALQRTNMTVVEVGDGVEATGTARLYQYLNMVKDKVWNQYVASITGKALSWESWTDTFVANQSEYPLPQVISADNRIKKIQSLYVTYGTQTYSRTGELIYTKAT